MTTKEIKFIKTLFNKSEYELLCYMSSEFAEGDYKEFKNNYHLSPTEAKKAIVKFKKIINNLK